MQMKKILERLHGQLKAKGLSAAAVSRLATGSPDTIRNWERRAKADKNPGASSVTLGAIAKVLDVPIRLTHPPRKFRSLMWRFFYRSPVDSR